MVLVTPCSAQPPRGTLEPLWQYHYPDLFVFGQGAPTRRLYGPLDGPSSSVTWTAAFAATGGHIATVKVGGTRRLRWVKFYVNGHVGQPVQKNGIIWGKAH